MEQKDQIMVNQVVNAMLDSEKKEKRNGLSI